MKRVLRKYGITINKKIPLLFLGIILTFFYIFTIEPSSLLQIGMFIVLLTLTIFVGLKVVLPKTAAVLISFFIFFLTFFKALQILDLLTIGILSAFMIALAIYLKQK
jgi:hypothetical protein